MPVVMSCQTGLFIWTRPLSVAGEVLCLPAPPRGVAASAGAALLLRHRRSIPKIAPAHRPRAAGPRRRGSAGEARLRLPVSAAPCPLPCRPCLEDRPVSGPAAADAHSQRAESGAAPSTCGHAAPPSPVMESQQPEHGRLIHQLTESARPVRRSRAETSCGLIFYNGNALSFA